jgi:signal recognition particle subunit SRP54
MEDFRDQLHQITSMGGITGMLDKLPGMGNMAKMAQQQVDVKQFARMEAMINSMTPGERRRPEIIQGSRKRRITRGSGTQVPDLNRLLKQHKQMQKMMKKMKGGGMEKMMRGMGGMMQGGGSGGMPPGMPPFK